MPDRLKRLLESMATESQSARGMLKYVALYHGLVNAIEAGVWKPGEQLPPEDAIAQGTRLSLGTVQRALRMLAEEGVLVRDQGRGTFVAGLRSRGDQVRHYRFLDDDEQTILPLYSRTLSIDAVPGVGPIRAFFAEESQLLEIRRVINVNLEFQCLDTIYLSAARFPDLVKQDPRELDGVSLNYELDSRYNAPTLRTEQRMRCLKLPDDVCKMMMVEPGSVGMRWDTLGYTYRDSALFYQRGFVPPNPRCLRVEGPQCASRVP